MIEWTSEQDFRVGSTGFACCPPGRTVESSAERFMLQKARWAVETYAELLAELEPKRILELGILEGGSVALLALLADPERLIAVDIAAEPVRALERFVHRHSLGERISLHFGVDQSDRAALRAIAADELGDEPLDLVIDDASHDLAPSRASFEALFPLLRPGGRYLLEDWSWAHAPVPIRTERTPLTVMVFELTMACARHPGLIAGLEINRGWAVVERGPEAPADGGLELASLYDERGRSLVPALERDDAPSGLRGRLAALLGNGARRG
jgi:predicted O-methyltransferase YrrM